MLSGCVGPKEVYEKLVEFFKKPPQYEWIRVVKAEETFGWLDLVNRELAKVSEYPFIIKNNTKYLHILIQVNFSNPISPKIDSFSQGYLNLTIVSPSGNYTKSYCTTAKIKEYEDFLYFPKPQPGNWKIVVKIFGYGKYKLIAETYQPT
ncbi:MAG: hypothetical protein DRN11_03250 [Thermoplasmata archaeon]|nr:MAG: hypothetical protein DRN11_03250 [Thermoplasmata archaeon]